LTEQETGELVAPDFAARRLRKQLRRLRPLLIVGAVLVLVIGAFWALYFSPLLTVQAVQVTGTTTISVVQIKQVAEVPIGDQLVRVDLAAIQARVETIPAVRSVSVSRSWPHDITIAVSERVPIAVVSRGATLMESCSGITVGDRLACCWSKPRSMSARRP
jgi:cell division protein FtsQ